MMRVVKETNGAGAVRYYIEEKTWFLGRWRVPKEVAFPIEVHSEYYDADGHPVHTVGTRYDPMYFPTRAEAIREIITIESVRAGEALSREIRERAHTWKRAGVNIYGRTV